MKPLPRRFLSEYRYACAAGILAVLALLVIATTRPILESPFSPATVAVRTPPLQAPQPRLVETYGKLPLRFEANQGQTDPQVKFVSRGHGYTLFLTGDGAVLTLRRASQKSKVEGPKAEGENVAQRSPFNAAAFPGFLLKGQLQRTTDNGPRSVGMPFARLMPNPQSPIPAGPESRAGAVLHLKLVGSNPLAKVTGLEELPGRSNYFIGNDPKKWRTNVANYAKVKYENVYPGIDLVYYGKESGGSSTRRESGSQLEYDFVVSPGADPRSIALSIAGAERIQIEANGDLVLRSAGGDVSLHKPLVYQPTTNNKQRTTADLQSSIGNRQFLDGRYTLIAKNQVRFAVPEYDASRPLIIDPSLSYSTYLGGSSADQGMAIAVDSAGNAYVTGATSSIDFPANPLYGTCSNCAFFPNITDVFVAKLNAAGSQLLYSTYLGGSDLDEGRGIAVDTSGNMYVTGRTFSSDFPVSATARQGTNSGSGDAFVAVISADGSTLHYSTFLGGSGLDEAQAIAVDAGGKAYITGDTVSDDFPIAGLPYQPARPVPGDTTTDAFVSVIDPSQSGALSLPYSTFLGGDDDDQGTGIAVDTSGKIYVTGQTISPNFPTSATAFDRTCGTDGACDGNSAADAFVLKLDPTVPSLPGLLYSTFLGGGSTEKGEAIVIDASGNAFVTGVTQSPNFPTTLGALRTTESSSGGFDAFVTKLNLNATGNASLLYSTYLGGTGFDEGRALAVDASGNVYVVGATSSTDFPATSAVQATCSGCPARGDAFISKLNAAGSALIFSSFLGGIQGDSASGIAVDTYGDAYVAGSTQSADFPTANALYPTFGDGTCGTDAYGNAVPCADAFVAKLTNLALPVVTLSATSLNFADQVVGTTSADKTVNLTNNGDAPLNLTITKDGDFAESDGCGSSVSAGVSCTITVAFSPTATGSRTGTITLTDDAYGSPQSIALVGTGVSAATMDLSPASLAFGDQVVGTSSSKTVTLSNTGTGLMNIGSIVSSLPAIFPVTSTCGSTLAAGVSCDITVSFEPTATGANAGSVTINDDAPGNPHSVTFTGTGVAPAVGLSPPTLDFGDQRVGQASATKTVTLSNSGTSALKITNILPSGDFTQHNDCGVLPATLAAGHSCTINVTLTPTTTGVRRGSVTITDDASDTPQSVSLTGNGVEPAVNLLPPSLTFGNQAVGTTSTAQTVTLTNNGTAALTISSIAASGDFAETDDCGTLPATLAAGGHCTLSVTFSPATTDVRLGSVTIIDDAPPNTHQVGLSGIGVAPAVSLSPPSLAFGNQPVGSTSAAQTVTLTNSGGAPLTISSIVPSGDFAQTNDCGTLPATLAAGAHCTLSVTFTPTTTDIRRGSVTVADDAPGTPHQVSLNGTGVAPAVSLSPPSLTFTNQPVGTTSTAQTVTLTNSGGAPLKISSITVVNPTAFTQTSTCPLSPTTLAAGDSCPISVTFTSTTTEAVLGAVNIISNAPGNLNTISLAGIGSGFALSANPTSKTVDPGQSAAYTLSVTPEGGFNQAVALTCTKPAALTLATCSILPPSVTPDGTHAATATVTVTTTARSMVVPTFGGRRPPLGKHTGLPLRLWLLALAMLAGLVVVRRARARVTPAPTLLLAGLMLLALMWAACGGGGGGGGGGAAGTAGTPAGTYYLTITATSGTLSKTTTLGLTVN